MSAEDDSGPDGSRRSHGRIVRCDSRTNSSHQRAIRQNNSV